MSTCHQPWLSNVGTPHLCVCISLYFFPYTTSHHLSYSYCSSHLLICSSSSNINSTHPEQLSQIFRDTTYSLWPPNFPILSSSIPYNVSISKEICQTRTSTRHGDSRSSSKPPRSCALRVKIETTAQSQSPAGDHQLQEEGHSRQQPPHHQQNEGSLGRRWVWGVKIHSR